MPYYPPSSGGGTPATSVTDETTYGIAAAVGTSTNYARQDHTHGSSDIAITDQQAARDQTVPANYCAVVVDYFEVPSGNVLELGADAVMEVIT